MTDLAGTVVRRLGSALSTVMRVETADDREAFEAFVRQAEPRLHRALGTLRGATDGRDAVAEALAWAWEHWAEVSAMSNPVGYLYRVGSSRSRPRRLVLSSPAEPVRSSTFEPGLEPALARLSERQRVAVVLVHGCQWSYQEVADALDVSKSSVGTHIERAMEHLRRELGVAQDG